MKQVFYPLRKQNIVRAWQQESTFLQAFNYVNELLNLPMIHVGLPLNSLLRHGDAKVLGPPVTEFGRGFNSKQLRRVMIVRVIGSLKIILALHIH